MIYEENKKKKKKEKKTYIYPAIFTEIRPHEFCPRECNEERNVPTAVSNLQERKRPSDFAQMSQSCQMAIREREHKRFRALSRMWDHVGVFQYNIIILLEIW